MIIPFLLLLLGCEPELPDRLGDCADTPCREAWVVANWPKDNTGTLAALDGIDDPVERIVLVTRLVETWPGDTGALCQRLTQGPARTRCERINNRPHLRTDPPDPPSSAPRTAGGPRAQNIAPPAPSTSPFYEVAPLAGPCAQRREQHVCYATQALREARQDASRAAAACAGIRDAKWVSECRFSAAEMLINARGVQGLRDATDLCVASPPFTGNCLAHMLVMLANRTPDSTETDGRAWEPILASAAGVEAEWKRRDPERADLYVDRFWSESLSLAYAATPEVTGAPLDHLPEGAVRHVHAGATFRLMELKGPAAFPTVSAWVDAVQAALLTRSATPYHPPPPPPPKSKKQDELLAESNVPGGMFQGKENLWDGDMAGDEAWPATFFWGTARRTWLPDARADIEICVLESAGQIAYTAHGKGDKASERAARALLEQGRSSTLPAAAWTAGRIIDRNLPKASAN